MIERLEAEFRATADRAPDPDRVLAGVIAAHQRRRGRRRAAAITASAVAVVALAATPLVLHTRSVPTDIGPSASVSATAVDLAPATPAPGTAPFSLGLLPVNWSYRNSETGTTYYSDPGDPGQEPIMIGLGTPASQYRYDTTAGGRPAAIFRESGVLLVMDLGDGTYALISAPSSLGLSDAQLRELADSLDIRDHSQAGVG